MADVHFFFGMAVHVLQEFVLAKKLQSIRGKERNLETYSFATFFTAESFFIHVDWFDIAQVAL